MTYTTSGIVNFDDVTKMIEAENQKKMDIVNSLTFDTIKYEGEKYLSKRHLVSNLKVIQHLGYSFNQAIQYLEGLKSLS